MSGSGRTAVFAPVIGAILAVLAGVLFGESAEGIIVFVIVVALIVLWLFWLNSGEDADAGIEVTASSDDSVEPVAALPDPLIQAASLLDALPIGVLVVDDKQQVVAANTMIREIFSLPREPGYPVETLRAQRMIRAVEQVQASGSPTDFEMMLSRRGDVTLRIHMRKLETDSVAGQNLMIAVEDITKARLADEVHRDFVANASHELKTPLAVVSGLIETLQGPARNDPVGTERFLGRLALQTRRMTRLIDDLMSLNRIEMNKRVMPEVPTDLLALIAETIDALRPAAEASTVTLTLHPGDETWTVLADREELGQLFGNLIDNAIKYGGSGGDVDVRIVQLDDPGEVGVRVSDTGPGIAREHLPRLTERFYRVDIGRSREHGGTGLGLAICKHIVQRHRGRMEIESIVGEGARFTVWLPCMREV